MRLRIGIMGGMFDPVHTGHLQVATLALDSLRLDRLHMVPCALPNHRDCASASQQHRQAMLEIATRSDQRLVVDDREYHRPGISYAVDTLKSFADEYPDAVLVYVMGWDSFNSLPGWHRWQALFDYAHLCAVSRPGQQLPTAEYSGEPPVDSLAQTLLSRRVSSVDALFSSAHGSILVLNDLALAVSSTAVREALQQGVQTSDVPAAVLDYIRLHQLYR